MFVAPSETELLMLTVVNKDSPIDRVTIFRVKYAYNTIQYRLD